MLPLEETALLVHSPAYVEWLSLFFKAWEEGGQPIEFGNDEQGSCEATH